jgi:hypothetical protein
MYDDLRVNGRDEELILVFRAHFARVREAEEIEVLVVGPRGHFRGDGNCIVRGRRCRRHTPLA